LDIEGIGAISGSGSFVIGPGPFALCGIGEPCGTIDGPAANGVAEPPILALMLSALTIVPFVRRRRSSIES
jgi:hypothetical protein